MVKRQPGLQTWGQAVPAGDTAVLQVPWPLCRGVSVLCLPWWGLGTLRLPRGGHVREISFTLCETWLLQGACDLGSPIRGSVWLCRPHPHSSIISS